MAAKISAADAAAFKQLKQDISAGTLGRFYIFHGEEAYLRDFYLGQMKKKLFHRGLTEISKGHACRNQPDAPFFQDNSLTVYGQDALPVNDVINAGKRRTYLLFLPVLPDNGMSCIYNIQLQIFPYPDRILILCDLQVFQSFSIFLSSVRAAWIFHIFTSFCHVPIARYFLQ